MGFKAINQDGKAVYSFNLDQGQWLDLKSSHKKQLKMNCCDAVAIPKTSVNGTPFFAHHTQGNCNHKPESVEHMFCKYLLILALKDHGWNAETEVSGCTPSGEKWIADVFATKGNSKVVFEVQWSGITLEEITRRNNKYKQSGVKCVWLKKNKSPSDFALLDESNRDLVIFGITPDFNVFGFHQYKPPCYTEKAKPISVDSFINALFGGGIKYGLKDGESVTASPYTTPLYDCECGSKISVLRSFLIKNNDGFNISKSGSVFNLNVNQKQLSDFMLTENIVQIKKRTNKYTVNVCCNKCGKNIDRQMAWGNGVNQHAFMGAIVRNATKIKSYWFIKNQDLH